jgi:drug/metabolite transporter (DMT)-like permease
MKFYVLILSVCSFAVLFLRFFYPEAVENVSHGLNRLFNSHINGSDAKNIIYFYPMLSIFISYFISYRHVTFKIIYILLIALNVLLLIFSLQRF